MERTLPSPQSKQLNADYILSSNCLLPTNRQTGSSNLPHLDQQCTRLGSSTLLSKSAPDDTLPALQGLLQHQLDPRLHDLAPVGTSRNINLLCR